MSVSRRNAVVVKAQKSEVQSAIAAAALAAVVGFSGVAPAYADISGEDNLRVVIDSGTGIWTKRDLFYPSHRSDPLQREQEVRQGPEAGNVGTKDAVS